MYTHIHRYAHIHIYIYTYAYIYIYNTTEHPTWHPQTFREVWQIQRIFFILGFFLGARGSDFIYLEHRGLKGYVFFLNVPDMFLVWKFMESHRNLSKLRWFWMDLRGKPSKKEKLRICTWDFHASNEGNVHIPPHNIRWVVSINVKKFYPNSRLQNCEAVHN